MKRYFFKYRPEFFSISLCAVIVTLPFNRNLSNLFIIISVIVWLLEGGLLEKLKRGIQNPLIVSFSAFYFVFILGLANTSNIGVGLYNLEKKFSLLILPWIIGTSKNFGGIQKQLASRCFLISVVTAAIVCLAVAFYRFGQTGDSIVFLHEELSLPIDFQPPYFALFLMLAFVLLSESLLKGRQSILRMNKAWSAVLMTFIAFVIIVLSARTTAIFLVLYVIFLASYYIVYKRVYWQSLAIVFLVLTTTTIAVNQSAYLKDRILRPLTSDINVIDGGGETGLSIRIVKWKCSLIGIMENPIFGTGSGDAVDYLVKCYEKKNFWGMYPQYRFNAHNQFLETALTFGFSGLLVFLVIIVVLLSEARKGRDMVFCGFILLFCFASLTESILERQWGVVFFAFFSSVFYFGFDKKV